MTKISIIGCGWLGLKLGERLVQEGYQVLGSTTRSEKLKTLDQAGIESFLFKLTPMPEGKSFQKLFESDTLFINIPPGRTTNPPEFYREQIKYLKYVLKGSSKVKRVIFISSTSFYPNNGSEVDENTNYNLENGSSKAVVWAEHEISQIKQQLIILRCGGLMGGNRIPGKWFSGKETQGKNNITNYIHREDIIEEIISLLQQQSWPEIKNLVSPKHYSRMEIVEAMAKRKGFALPIWVSPHETPTKKVTSQFDLGHLKDPIDY